MAPDTKQCPKCNDWMLRCKMVAWNDKTKKYDQYVSMIDRDDPNDSIGFTLLVCRDCNHVEFTLD